MLRNVLYLAVGSVLLSGCFVSVHREDCLAVGEDSRILRHVVMFKFKDGTSSKQIKEIEDAFRALPDKIDAICGEFRYRLRELRRPPGLTHNSLLSSRFMY